MGDIQRTQAGGEIIAGRRRIPDAAIHALRTSLRARNRVIAHRDVVKNIRGGLRQPVEHGIDVSHSSRRLRIRFRDRLVEQRDHPGENRACRGGATDMPDNAAANDFVAVMHGRGKGDVRQVAAPVVWHTGTELPGRFHKQRAGPTAAAFNRIVRDRFIPDFLRNVAERGSARRPVRHGPPVAGDIVELRAAHGCHFRDAGRVGNRGALGCLRSRRTAVAGGGAGIARGHHPGDSLGAGLLRHGAQRVGAGNFAAPVAHRHHGREVLIHGVLRRGVHAS